MHNQKDVKTNIKRMGMECILDNTIEVESYDIVKNAEVSNQDDVSQNAVDEAMLKKQLYCPSLFQLWRTGAFAVRYEASKDDEDFGGVCGPHTRPT